MILASVLAIMTSGSLSGFFFEEPVQPDVTVPGVLEDAVK